MTFPSRPSRNVFYEVGSCILAPKLLSLLMRIGITGATGFIGSTLAKAALQKGHEVIAFSRQTNVTMLWNGEVRRLDFSKPESIDLSGLDAVVHLAGESVMGYWTADKKKKILESRVQSTKAMADAFKASPNGPRTFICASGAGFYGDRGDEILTETSAKGSGFLADVCEQWEAGAAATSPWGVRVVHLRTGMVLGRDGGAWPLLKKLFSFFLGSRLGDGKQWVPWIHIDDEVGVILHALEHDTCRGPLNLGSPHPVTNAEMTRTIASVLHRPVMPPVPAFALKLLMGEMSGVTLGSERMLPEAVQAAGYVFKHNNLKEALTSLL